MDEEKSVIGKIFFKKYKILKLLGSGEYSNVFLVKNLINKTFYAAKIEEKEKYKFMKYLEKESYILYSLQGYGIPEIITYGHSGKYNILIQQLLGKSLKYLFDKSKNKIKDLCMAAIQIIDRIKFIHSKYIIHRDIKPENFLVGYPNTNFIYIIDFGLSAKYRSSRTKKHINFQINKFNPGTAEYLSLNASLGVEQTRRDDLESMAYMLIRLGKGKLLWDNVKAKTRIDYLFKIYNMKKNISVEKLCQNLPKEFCIFTEYTRNLKFEELPDYNYLKKLFLNVLKKMGEENDLNFSWINCFERKNNYKRVTSPKTSRNSNNTSRKSTLRTRLLNKLENSSLSKKHSTIDNENNNMKSQKINVNINNFFSAEKLIFQKVLPGTKTCSKLSRKIPLFNSKKLDNTLISQLKNNNHYLTNSQDFENIKKNNISPAIPLNINFSKFNIKNASQIIMLPIKNINLNKNESFTPKIQRTKKITKTEIKFTSKNNCDNKTIKKNKNVIKKPKNTHFKNKSMNTSNNNIMKHSIFLSGLDKNFNYNNINNNDLETDINYYNGDRNRIYNLVNQV